MHSQKIKAFTLVELIIVITILAILATIGFMSFQIYTADARDSNRMTTLRTIGNGLDMYQLKNLFLPIPDEKLLTTLDASGNIISYQGYVGTTIQKTIKLTNETKDPKDNNYYTYSINGTKTKYQLLTLLENNPNLAYNENIKLINQANARIDYTTRYPYTLGQKVGIFFTGTTNQPYQETLSTQTYTLALSGVTTQMKVIFSNAQVTNSGTIIATGSSLPAIVATETQSVATASQEAQRTYSCTGTLVIANAIITNNTNLTSNTTYQNTNSSGKCYYTCTGGYSGNDCSSKVNIVDFFGDNSGKALYKFENNVNDTSGNYNGTASNNVYTTGKFGTGADFSTLAPNTTIPNSILSGLTSFTLSAWINMNNVTTDTTPLGTNAVSPQYFLTPIRVANGYVYGAFGMAGTSGIYTPNSTLAISTGTWNLVTFIFNTDKTIQMSLNGGTLTTKSSASSYNLSQVINNFNLFNNVGNDYTSGKIDHLRFFNKALNQSEITQLYNE